MTALALQLRHQIENLVVPTDDAGSPATLVGLLPCEIALGQVAVACWVDSGGSELLEVVDLASGTRCTDAAALREALTLAAMVETLEDLIGFERLDELAAALVRWTPSGDVPLSEPLDRARAAAQVELATLASLAPGDEPRLARPQLLDAMAGALRALDRAWEQLEQQAAIWTDTSADSQADAAELWRILAMARRGPLAVSPGEAMHVGRDAGRAMAADVTAAAD